MKRRLFIVALFFSICATASAATWGTYTLVSSNTLIDLNGAAISNFSGGLAFDGTNLWYTTYLSGAPTNWLYRIDPSNQTVTGQWPLPFEAHGVAWDGTQLRIADTKYEPRIRAYDLQGNPVGSQLVAANSPMCQGITWDGSHLWGADDWWLMQFDATGGLSRLYSSSWIKPYSSLSWDGTNLVAHLWNDGRIVNIDPLTGNFSSYQKADGGGCIAVSAGRMWFVKGYGGRTDIHEVVVPASAPFPPLSTTWGAFQLFDGFAVPQRSDVVTGAGLGASGADFWYCDSFNVSKVCWSNRAVNTATLDMNWPIAGGAYDIASDGTRVWRLQYYSASSTVVYQTTMQGAYVTNFFLPHLVGGEWRGIAWDGAALWVAGTANPISGIVHQVRRYSTDGKLLFGPVMVGAKESNLGIDDLTWHNGKLWLNRDSYGLPDTINCVDPASGNIIGRYAVGGTSDGYSGLASDGTNMFVVGGSTFQGSVQPSVGDWILRLGPPTNTIPPKLTGATTASNTITFTFSKAMSIFDTQFNNKTNYVLESPSGTPVAPASFTLTPIYTTNNQVRLSGLPITSGATWRVTVHLVRDTTGNLIREDDMGNALSGIMGGLTAPAEITATSLTTNQNVISWRDASAGETGFRVERCLGSTGTWVQVADIPTTNGSGFGGVMSYTNINVSGDYTYRVYAYNTGSSPYSDVQTAYQSPLSFTIAGAASAADGNFTVRWNGEAGKTYRVCRSASPGFEAYDVVLTGVAGVSPVTTLTDPTPKALGLTNVFYRIERE